MTTDNSISFDCLPKAVANLQIGIDQILKKIENLQLGVENFEKWYNLKELCEYLPDKPAQQTVYEWVKRYSARTHTIKKKMLARVYKRLQKIFLSQVPTLSFVKQRARLFPHAPLLKPYFGGRCAVAYVPPSYRL